jgi:hypothetical protein
LMDMKELRPLVLLVVLAPSLLAQTAQPNAIGGPDDKEVRELNEAMLSVVKYCVAVDSFSESHLPRLFAETRSSLVQSSEWVEFSSKTEWERAGKPKPIALAWHRGGRIIRVAIALKSGDDSGKLYFDYCYGPDGKLAWLRSVPRTQAACDEAYFRCELYST